MDLWLGIIPVVLVFIGMIIAKKIDREQKMAMEEIDKKNVLLLNLKTELQKIRNETESK